MTEVIDLLKVIPNPLALVVDVLIVLIVGVWLWGKAVKPAWAGVRNFVKNRERQERLNTFADTWHDTDEVRQDAERWGVLQKIADQFKPNGGLTLWDQIQRLNVAVDENREAIQEIGNKIDTYLLERQNGGRRKYDPHEEGVTDG